MSLIIDLFKRRYDKDKYHCAHFAIDAHTLLTGKDMREALSIFLFPIKDIKVFKSVKKSFKVITGFKENGDLAVFTNRSSQTHCGIYYDGKIVHIRETGVAHDDIQYLNLIYNRIRFYRYDDNSC